MHVIDSSDIAVANTHIMTAIEEQRATELSIAQTIINQIKYADKNAFQKWNTSKHLVALNESKNYQGGIQFSTHTNKLDGFIRVNLRWVDDYEISFLNTDLEEVKTIKGVYCDMLVDIINEIL